MLLLLEFLTVRVCMGGLCARPVETLLISRRVNAGKFCCCMTLLSHQLSVKWRKYQSNKLANFFLYLPYRKCCLKLISRLQQLLQRRRLACVTLTNGLCRRPMSACYQLPAIRNTYWWKDVGLCLTSRLVEFGLGPNREISVHSRRSQITELSCRPDASEHYFAL